MSGIKVTSEDLHTLSGQVSGGSTTIQDQLTRLQNQVTGVVGGDWQGLASGQFNALYDEWNKSAAGLQDALNAATQYQQTEDGIASSMR